MAAAQQCCCRKYVNLQTTFFFFLSLLNFFTIGQNNWPHNWPFKCSLQCINKKYLCAFIMSCCECLSSMFKAFWCCSNSSGRHSDIVVEMIVQSVLHGWQLCCAPHNLLQIATHSILNLIACAKHFSNFFLFLFIFFFAWNDILACGRRFLYLWHFATNSDFDFVVLQNIF